MQDQLKVIHQVAHTDTKDFGNSHQSMDAHGLPASFDLSKIKNRMQAGFFRQLFLAQAGRRQRAGPGLKPRTRPLFNPRRKIT